MDEKIVSKTIPNVLYSNDEPEGGKQLRLARQYFFASCPLQEIIRLLAPDARQSLLAEALERWPLPLFGASSRSPLRSTFRGTGKLSRPITNRFWPVLSRRRTELLQIRTRCSIYR